MRLNENHVIRVQAALELIGPVLVLVNFIDRI